MTKIRKGKAKLTIRFPQDLFLRLVTASNDDRIRRYMPGKWRPLSLDVPRKIFERLERESYYSELTISEYIRERVEEALEKGTLDPTLKVGPQIINILCSGGSGRRAHANEQQPAASGD